MLPGCVRPTLLVQELAETRRQRQTEDLLDGTVRLLTGGGFSSPCRVTGQFPGGGTITGPATSAGIDQGFREVNRMALHPLPVCCQQPRHKHVAAAIQDVRT